MSSKEAASRRTASVSIISPSLFLTAPRSRYGRRAFDELGIEHDAIDDQGFAVALNLRDPDGIAVEFYVLIRRAER